MVRPVMPIIEYQLNYDYITTILCENTERPSLECNGKCYLIERLSDASKLSQEQHSMPVINIDDYPISPIMDFSMKFSVASIFVNHIYKEGRKLNDMYTPVVLRPPILS